MIHLICPNPAVDRTLLFESIHYAVPNRPIEVREFPGGKSFNVAYAYTYDSEPSNITIHTMLGGLYGQHIKNLATERGYHVIDTKVNQNSRLCNILVDTSEASIIPVYEKGFDLDDSLLKDFTTNLIKNIKDGDTIVFSGSLMQGMPDTYIADIQDALRKQGLSVKLCVDTSGEALVEAYKAKPYLIKINDEEILDLFPNESLETIEDYQALLKNKVDPEIEHFVITLGSKGVIGRMNGEFYFGKSEKVESKNPVACGDFFLGRLTKGLIDDSISPIEIIEDALLFATANVLSWYPEITSEALEQVKPLIEAKKI